MVWKLVFFVDHLIPGGDKRLYVLKQTYTWKLLVCLNTYAVLLPPGIIELMMIFILNNLNDI